MSTIANNVRRIIRQRGLKQCAVAAMAGYDARRFSSLLRGKRSMTDEDVHAIARALSVTPNELFETRPQDKTA